MLSRSSSTNSLAGAACVAFVFAASAGIGDAFTLCVPPHACSSHSVAANRKPPASAEPCGGHRGACHRAGSAWSDNRLRMRYSKWDNLVDEDEYEDDEGNSRVPADMKYVLPNIKRQADTFEALYGMADESLISDVWLQSPADDEAFFVGRVARVSDVSPERAIDRQYPLIERHGWALRPIDLHPQRGPFVVYYAPGNSVDEVKLGQDPSIRLTRIEEDAVLQGGGSASIRTIEVGFQGAGYDATDEEAYRVDMTSWQEEGGDGTNVLIDEELKDFAIPATTEEDAAMQEKVDKLLESSKDIEKFFDDPAFTEFMDSAFPKENK